MGYGNYFIRNPGEYELLKDKHFVFVGLGSFGGALAEISARSGLQHIDLIDPEVVAPENIGRHIACVEDIGKPKVDVVRDKLLRINPEAEVKTIRSRFNGVLPSDRTDLILSCADSFSCDSLVNLTALRLGLPAIFPVAWGAASVGEIYFVIPG